MKPLADLTLIDLTVNVPGPFCSMMLGDLGARVIKVEPPGGDALRHSPGIWAGLNRGKESIVLDLKTARDREALGELARAADIVLEGWRPGVARRLGADYPTLSARNPGLVYCSISGFGQDGPWRDRPGHDINYLALTGYLGLQAAVEGRPWPPAVLVSDMASGLHAAVATLASVNGRRASGRGTYIDLSMAEAALSLLAPEIGDVATGGAGDPRPNVTFVPHYGLFPCADGRWLSLGIVHEDHFWQRFCAAVGLDQLAELKFPERLALGERLRDDIRDKVLSKTSGEWERMLKEADVPAAVVLELQDVVELPQFRARGAFVDGGERTYLAHPAHFSTGSVTPSGDPPALGEHTEAVLAELGLASERPTQAEKSRAS